MNALDRFIGYFSPARGMRRQRERMLMQRAYEGAARTDGWRPRRAGASANADHQADARELRIRARSLVQNVPYIARGLQVLVNSTVGTGIEPRFEGRDEERLNKLWARWIKVADADGIFDFYGLQAAAYRAMEQDGEVLIRRRPRRLADGLPVPLQLQLLEIDWLDSQKNGSAPGGGTIIGGIEYDMLGNVRNYWLFDAHPGDAAVVRRATQVSKPVSAASIIHLFNPTRPGQGRGITRFAPVIARCRDLMLYEDAELARKNLETRLGVVISGDVNAIANPGGEAATGYSAAPIGDDGKLPYGNLGELPSGGITQVPAGLNVTALEPKPANDYVPYCVMQQHLIAAGINVPYESMTGDMTKVNFSSARIRQIEFRRDCECMQWITLIPRLCETVASWWLEDVELAGLAKVQDASADWSTPRWDYVNPQQDVNAEIDAISTGLLTPSEALRRRGYKPDQVFSELGSDFERLKASGALNLMQFLMANGRADSAQATAPTQPDA